MPSFQKLVILFTRYPQAGKCKSRLIPDLGAEGALSVYKQLVSHILKRLNTFIASTTDTDFTIFYTGGSQRQTQKWLNHKYICKQQQGKDLGQRMATALTWGLNRKQDTILIGSDCPDIDAALLNKGFQALESNDIVIGPAHDGGYYLIGVKANLDPLLCSRLFDKIPWGSSTVFSDTIALTEALRLRTHILKKLHDIDTKKDLQYFHHCPHPE